MNYLHLRLRGSGNTQSSSYSTHYEAQLAVDRLLQEYSGPDHSVTMSVVDGRVHWDICDRDGELCSCWVSTLQSEGYPISMPSTRSG